MESTVNETINSFFPQAYQQISPYATYFKMSVLFLGTPIIIIPALLVIYIIMKNKKLQTKRNFFLINLLITDIVLVFSNCLISGTLMILYLLDVDIEPNCTVIFMLRIIPALANKLCFLPVIVDRLLYIAFPFDYKRIMTNKVVAITIITFWLATVCIIIPIATNLTLLYLPPIGDCINVDNSILLRLVLVGPQLVTVLAIIITSIYFRYRVVKSKKFFERTHRNAVERRKAISAGTLLDKLRKELRPTISVLIMGGVDAMFNLLTPVIWAATRLVFTDPHIRRLNTQLIILIPQLCQSLSHSLTYGIYNKEIRKQINKFRKNIFLKHSKIITLAGGAR